MLPCWVGDGYSDVVDCYFVTSSSLNSAMWHLSSLDATNLHMRVVHMQWRIWSFGFNKGGSGVYCGQDAKNEVEMVQTCKERRKNVLVKRCERLTMTSLKRGKDRPNKYEGGLIRQEMRCTSSAYQ